MKHFIAIIFLIFTFLIGCGNNPAPTTIQTQPTNIAAPPTSATQPTAVPASTLAQAQPTTAPTGGNAQTPPDGAPFDIVKQATLNAFQANALRVTTLIEAADGTKTTLVLEYLKPDRVRVTDSDGGERIAIKEKGMWAKEGDTWKAEGPEAANFLFAFFEPAAVQESFQIIQVDSVTFVGPELLNGKPTFVYTYKTRVDLGTSISNGTGKIWIGAIDKRAYQGESISDSVTTPGKQDRTFVTYEYDIPLTINAPQ